MGFHKNGSISTPRASPELSKTHTDTANRAESFYQGPGPQSDPQKTTKKVKSKLYEQPSHVSELMGFKINLALGLDSHKLIGYGFYALAS